MIEDDMVAVVLAGLAFVLAGVRMMRVYQMSQVDAQMLAVAVAKLCRAGNVERAAKLCEAGGETMAAGMFGGGVSELVRARTADAADAGFEGRRIEWTASLARGRWMAMAAIAVGLAAGVVAAVAPEAGGVIGHGAKGMAIALGVAAAAGLLAVVSVARERRAMDAAVAAWRHEMLPALRAMPPAT